MKKFADFKGSWMMYLDYLRANDAISPDVGCGTAARPAVKQETNCVPWAGLSWKAIEEHGYLSQIESHCQKLLESKPQEYVDDYIKYLKRGVRLSKRD